MRMLVDVKLPLEKFNAAVRDASIGQKLQRILEDTQPESVYFTERDGKRGCTMIVDVPEPSAVPKIAEPWFLLFDATVEFHIVMSPEDLQKADIGMQAKKWF